MNNIIAIYKVVQTTHPGEMFEPTIFSSVGGDDDHYATPPRHSVTILQTCASSKSKISKHELHLDLLLI
jgi:hypothetical protein